MHFGMSTLLQTSSFSHAPLSAEQTTAWIRGLLTIAWADGHFEPEEQQMILSLTDAQGEERTTLDGLTTISGEDLAGCLGYQTALAENFLRTAVMVAIADGIYSFCEDEILYQFAQALHLESKILEALRKTICVPSVTEVNTQASDNQAVVFGSSMPSDLNITPDVLHPIRDWLDGLSIHDPRVARFLCRMIPSQCPFERDVTLFGHKVVHIPPLCKLNPLYEQLVSLRFRALSYLADDCHEDISQYC
jgi:tellurite resistance protein